MNPLEALFSELESKKGKRPPRTELEKAALASNLIEHLAKFNETHQFTTGQLIQVKPGFDTMIDPGVCIVSKVLNEPVYSNAEFSSCFFKEPLDMIVGVIGGDGAFREFHADSRRYEPYTGKTAETI